MKLAKTTVVLAALAVILGGFVYFYEIQFKQQQKTIETQRKSIFDFQAEDIKELTIDRGGQTLKFERAGNEQKLWQMRQPEDVPASDAAVSFLVGLLTERKREKSFTIPPNQKQEYGLDKPLATIEIKLKNQKNHQLILGQLNFDKTLIYAQVDPQKKTGQELEVLLLPIDFQYAVERKFEEWKEEAPADK